MLVMALQLRVFLASKNISQWFEITVKNGLFQMYTNNILMQKDQYGKTHF